MAQYNTDEQIPVATPTPTTPAAPTTIPETTITGNPPTATSLNVIGTDAPAPPATPLSTQGYLQEQMKSGEERKLITSQLAEMQGKGAEAEAKIAADAAKEQDVYINGDKDLQAKALENMANAKQRLAASPKGSEEYNRAQEDIHKQNINLQLSLGSKQAMAQATETADQRDTELRAKIAEAQAQHVDPNHYWASKSTGGKMLAGIGIILGGMGAGLQGRGGENPAMQAINRAVDADIDAQKANINNNWKAIASTHELDDSAFNRELHNQTWQNTFRQGAYEKVKLDLSAAAATTQSQVVRQNALIGIQDITDKQQQARNALYNIQVASQQSELKRIRELEKHRSETADKFILEKGVDAETANNETWQDPYYKELIQRGLAPSYVLNAKRQENAFQKDISSGMDPEVAAAKYPELMRFNSKIGVVTPDADKLTERAVTIDGQQYLAPDAKRAEEAATAFHSANEIKRINAEIMQLYNKPGTMSWEDRAKLDSLIDQGTLHYPKMQTGSTRINDTEIKMGQDTYTGKADWLRTDMFNRKRAHLSTINTQADQRIADIKADLTPVGRPTQQTQQPQQQVTGIGINNKVYGTLHESPKGR